MLNTFYNWITYNPKNISVHEIFINLTIIYLILLMFLCLFFAIFDKITLKTFLLSILCAPYLSLCILWEFCFISESLFKVLIPIYPLLLYLACIKLINYLKNKQ